MKNIKSPFLPVLAAAFLTMASHAKALTVGIPVSAAPRVVPACFFPQAAFRLESANQLLTLAAGPTLIAAATLTPIRAASALTPEPLPPAHPPSPAQKVAALTSGFAASAADSIKALEAGDSQSGASRAGTIFGEKAGAPSREPVTASAVRASGVVSWWNEVRGYGFITPRDGGEPVYFVANEIQGPNPADTLYKPIKEGDLVEYETAPGPHGNRAVRIIRRRFS